MILDRAHRAWAIFTLVLLGVSLVAYIPYAIGTPGGPRGGTTLGLVFGFTGTAFILFAALLGARKKVPHIRLGRASTWLKGHLWLGGAAFPLVLFHGGFGFGGALTTVLMWLFIWVFVTGIYGLALQQFLPRLMTHNVPQETIYEQIDRVLGQLRDEAESLVRDGASRAVQKVKAAGAIQGRVVESRAAVAVDATEADRESLQRFFDLHVAPFLEPRGTRGSPLTNPGRRAVLFEELRRSLSAPLHEATRDLDALCEQRSQLETQRRMHHWLHGWLYVHVPLSMAMTFLTAVHAVTALLY